MLPFSFSPLIKDCAYTSWAVGCQGLFQIFLFCFLIKKVTKYLDKYPAMNIFYYC
jgi:hypothetical protein